MTWKSLLIFLLFPVHLISQPVFDVFNVRYNYFPNQYFKDASAKKTGEEFNVILMLPWIQKDSNKIITGVAYRKINSNDVSHAFSLHSLGVWIGYDHKWKNKKWNATVFFIPKLSADEFNLKGRNVQYGGVVLIKYKKSLKINFHAGLYYNRELFGNYFVPLIGINWKASDKMNIYGNLPATMNLEYKLNSSLYMGISYSAFTSTFSLHGNLKELYLKEGDKGIGYTQLRLFLNWYVRKNFVLFFEPGITYKRKYTLYDYSDEKFPLVASTSQSRTKDGFLLMAGFAYRIRVVN